jgi:hypothetical protein
MEGLVDRVEEPLEAAAAEQWALRAADEERARVLSDADEVLDPVSTNPLDPGGTGRDSPTRLLGEGTGPLFRVGRHEERHRRAAFKPERHAERPRDRVRLCRRGECRTGALRGRAQLRLELTPVDRLQRARAAWLILDRGTRSGEPGS